MAARDYSRMSIEQVEALAEAGDPYAQEAIRQAFAPVVTQVDELMRSAHRQIASISKPPPELEPITPRPVRTFQDELDGMRVHFPHVSSAERWQRIGVIVAVASLLVTLGAADMGMTFDGLPRDVVVAVNKLGGEYGSEVEGAALLSELQAMGHDPDTYRMVDLMKHLKESGYLTFYRAQGGVEAIDMIQLGPRGLQAVAGWPTDGSLTAGQVEALISAIEARAESAGSEAEGGKLRAAAAAMRDAGVSAVGEAVGVWLSKQTGMG